jgi:hypothetical protein
MDETWLVFQRYGKPNVLAGPFLSLEEAMRLCPDDFDYECVMFCHSLEDAVAERAKEQVMRLEPPAIDRCGV